MKQFYSFTGEDYHPMAAMGDFVGDFDKLENAIDELTKMLAHLSPVERQCRWAKVWDSHSRKEVWDHFSLEAVLVNWLVI